MKCKLMIITISIMLLFCSCTSVESTNVQQYSTDSLAETVETTQPEEKTLFSDAPLEELLLTSYSIEDLQAYFGPYCTTAENSWANIVTDLSVYNYCNVIKTFSNGCLRAFANEENSSIYVYSVFKVEEGGYFYVIWGGYLKEDESSIDQKWINELSACFMLYVTSLKSISDFDSIEIGVSTAEDVVMIDPAAQFHFGMGRGLPSWHLLEDGSVLEILYSRDKFYETHSRGDLLVESIEIVERKTTGCCLAYINPDDLP